MRALLALFALIALLPLPAAAQRVRISAAPTDSAPSVTAEIPVARAGSNYKMALSAVLTLDPELAAIYALTSAANKGVLFTGSGTAATYDLSAPALTVLDDASVSAMVDTLFGASSSGSGGAVRVGSPTLTTPNLGTPSALVLTNATGLPTTGLVDDAVTLAKQAEIAATTIIGNNTGSTANPIALTATQANNTLGRYTALLGSDHSVSSTTQTEVTGLQISVPAAGTYAFEYTLICQSTSTTVGLSFAINYTGTNGRVISNMTYPSTGTTAATGSAENIVANLTGSIYEASASTAEGTTGATLGPFSLVAAQNTDILIKVFGVVVATGAGDLELWHGSDTTTATTVEDGSAVIVELVQ